MKILDIRGNLIKIESSQSVAISSLLKIIDNNQEYLAQVLYTEVSGQQTMLFAKVLSLIETPLIVTEISDISTNAVCEEIRIADIIPNFGKKPEIVLGEISHEKKLATASKGFFDKKLIIVSENSANSAVLVENFTHQIKNIGKTSIIFDNDGSFDGIKLIAGRDFKLPLNEHAIQFIYDKYFSDITEESKAQISDIFNELKKYAATVPYIPFNTFKSVIDEVFNYSQNISLFFFKTKLEQLHRANIFANTHEEVMNWASLSEFGAGTLIIDLSKVGRIFVSEYISLIVRELNQAQLKIYAFVKPEDSFADKDFLRELLESSPVTVSYIVKPEFKFLTALKQNCASYIITGDVKKCDNFDYCKFLLKNLTPNKYILTGSYTSPISLIFDLKEITEVVPRPQSLEELKQPIQNTVSEAEPDFKEPQYIDEQPIAEEVVETAQPVYEEIPSYEQTEEVATEMPVQDYSPEGNIQENNDIETVTIEEEISEPSEVIQDYTPQNIFSTEDDEAEESYKETEATEEFATTEEQEQPLSQDDSSYEVIDTAVFEEETQMEIQDYVPTEQESEEEEDNNLEIVDYVPDAESTLSLEESIIDNTPIEEPTLQFEEGSSQQLSLTDASEETLEDLGDNDEFREPEADTKLIDEDLELELSLEEPDAYEPIIDNEENNVNIIDDTVTASEEDLYNTPSEEEINDDFKFSTQDFSFADDSDDSAEEDEDTESLITSDKTAEEILDEQIKRDVDRVYMAQPKEEQEDELSEDDLDFIEELVGADDIVVEESDEIDADTFLAADNNTGVDMPADEESDDEPLIPVKNNTATPAVPIYSAEIPEDAIVQSDPIQQGDRVIHVKFGIGVVEKIFSYGTKNFCSINFENIGRKVLDPNVTELKRA